MVSEKNLSKVKGGVARGLALSPDKRKEIAKKAAVARWGLQATHKGNFKEHFGIDVECYVLNDSEKTGVVSQTGMARALGMSSRGNSFPNFLATRAMSEAVGGELKEKIQNPIKFQWSPPGGMTPPVITHGFDATLLIDVCKAIVKAEGEGKLHSRQSNIAKQAHVILAASAKAGIKGLVYAVAGYNPTAEEVITAFKVYVREEAREYEKEFPDQLYQQWYRLYQLPKPERNKPWKFMHLTVNQVYRPLARSRGHILELTQNQRAGSNERGKRLHQFLSEVGVKALRQHLGQLLGIAQISKDQAEYEKFIEKVFGEQQSFDF